MYVVVGLLFVVFLQCGVWEGSGRVCLFGW